MRRDILSVLFVFTMIPVLAGCAGGGNCPPCACRGTTGHGKRTPVGEADRVKSTCGTDCECICLEFPGSHAGRRCACGVPNQR